MTRLNDSHIGWWCPEFQNMHDLDARPCPSCIPVFAPLATPELSTETRADMEACAEVVVAVDDHDNSSRFCPAKNQGADTVTGDQNGYGAPRWGLMVGTCEPWLWRRTRRGLRNVVDGTTEADAVLWVIEGKLPGGES